MLLFLFETGQLGAAGVHSGRDVTDSPLDQRNPMQGNN